MTQRSLVITHASMYSCLKEWCIIIAEPCWTFASSKASLSWLHCHLIPAHCCRSIASPQIISIIHVRAFLCSSSVCMCGHVCACVCMCPTYIGSVLPEHCSHQFLNQESESLPEHCLLIPAHIDISQPSHCNEYPVDYAPTAYSFCEPGCLPSSWQVL